MQTHDEMVDMYYEQEDEIENREFITGKTETALVVSSKPRDIEALNLDQVTNVEEALRLLEMRSSYIDSPNILIDDKVNLPINVVGVWINDVPGGEKIDGTKYGPFTQILLKLDEVDSKNRNIIIRFHGRQAIADAELWVKLFGWGDWKEPVSFIVNKSGQRTTLQMIRKQHKSK